MADLADGLYRISFTPEQFLTGPDSRAGGLLMLLPDSGGPGQDWKVQSTGNGAHTISTPRDLHVSYDGDPDMHELSILLPEARDWHLTPGDRPDSFIIGVPNTPMRLGMSLLRVFPPRIALAPEYGPAYQAWTFQKVG
ncbi:hypothetical protein ABZV31_35625 [Streptomyces sp. NPDC005202]|uniref:hypothetical protein n=1 Tax=Streptomyces sp. NPDC005202 TaxID=3157021 RepID=UPI0033BEAB93